MRYLVAAGIAGLILLAVLAYHWWVASMVSGLMEQARVRAGLPAGSPMGDIGIHVSGPQMTHIQIDHLLSRFWFVLLPVLLAICFGIAASLPRARSTAGRPAESPSQA
jgi:hypothetical protein